MADERTYGFNRDDATALIHSISHSESWYPEIKPRGGGGGTHRIWFTVVSVECVSATEMILTVDPIWYTGGCTASIPGEDSYGHVIVEDICSILLYYTATWLDGTDDGIPKTGSATYMWPRTGTCTAKWLVDEICQSPECA